MSFAHTPTKIHGRGTSEAEFAKKIKQKYPICDK